MKFGFARWQSLDFDVFPLHACSPTCAKRFECGFFCGEACGVVYFGLTAFLAVLDLTFCIYSIQESIAEALDRIPNAIILNNVDAYTGNHSLTCYR